MCQHITKKSQHKPFNEDSKPKVCNEVPILPPHSFQELNFITRNPKAMKLNFSPIKHPKVLQAILANGYSINFTKDSRYLHTKSLKRCKQRLTHNSSWFCSSSHIIITFIFNSELITAASSNRKGNNSINVKAEKQRKANGESNVSLGAVPTQTILQPQTVGKGWEAHKPISTRLTWSTKVLPQTADDKRALTHICWAHLITKWSKSLRNQSYNWI